MVSVNGLCGCVQFLCSFVCDFVRVVRGVRVARVYASLRIVCFCSCYADCMRVVRVMRFGVCSGYA